jgi:AcrR family transcriptional regulator
MDPRRAGAVARASLARGEGQDGPPPCPPEGSEHPDPLVLFARSPGDPSRDAETAASGTRYSRWVSAVAPQGEGEDQTTPRSRKGVQTRARLLEAAKQVFEERGFLEARISDIAERAKLSHYFDSKEQVFRELAKTLDDRLSEPMGSVIFAPGSTASPRDRIFLAVHRHLERYREEARIMGVIEEVARYDEHVFAVRATGNARHRQEIADSIRWMQRRRLADRTLDAEIAAAALGSMVERFAEMWLAQKQLDASLDDAANTLATLFVNALGLKP